MIATSQQEALELGLKTYMDGVECRNKHNGRKCAVNRSCVECVSERGQRRIRRRVDKLRDPQRKTMDDWALIRDIQAANTEVWGWD